MSDRGGRSAKPAATLEHGHRFMPQYYGMNSAIVDPRPSPSARRRMSDVDDPARAKFVNQMAAKYRARSDHGRD